MTKESTILPDRTVYRIKKDRFRQNRGSSSQMLKISCAQCNHTLLIYQKDGPGELLRCYIDRIAWPAEYAAYQNSSNLNKIPLLICPHCNNLIGVPMIYEEENRLAYRMIFGKYRKSIYKNQSEEANSL
jgi:hypothetical protein